MGGEPDHATPAQPPRGGHGCHVCGSVLITGADQLNWSSKIEDRRFYCFVHDDTSPEFVALICMHDPVTTRTHAAAGLIVLGARRNRPETNHIDVRSIENSGSCY